MTIAEKYSLYRSHINNGDIINIRGNSMLARIINWADAKDGVNAYWNHSLVVMEEGNRLLALEAEANGVRPDYLSQVILSSKDFCILRPIVAPQELIDEAVDKSFIAGENGIPYDTWSLPKILAYRKVGLKSKIMSGYPHKEICSVYAFETFGSLLPLTCYNTIIGSQGFLTPQDGIRYRDGKQVQLLAIEILD